MRLRFLRFVMFGVGLALAVGWGQQRQGPVQDSTNALDGLSESSRPGSSGLASTFPLTGKVLFPEGTPTGERVRVQVVCNGRIVREGYADSKGRFRLELNRASTLDPTEVHLVCADGSGVNLSSCELIARSERLVSRPLALANRPVKRNPNVGTLVLRRTSAAGQGEYSSGLQSSPGAGIFPERPQTPASISLSSLLCSSASALAAADRGRRHLQGKEYPEAAAAFETSLEECPEQQDVRLDLSRALTFQGRFEEAAAHVEKVLEAHPDSESALVGLAFVEFMARRFDDAVATADKALKKNSRSLPALKLKANAHYLAGREQESEKTFITAMELEPNDEEVHYMLGRIYYQQNRFDHAVGQFQAVLRLNPKSFKSYDNLGLCYEALHQEELAIKHFMAAIKLVYQNHPHYGWPYANLANLMIKRGELDKAFSLAAEASKRDPYTARNFFLTGKALHAMDKLDLSVRWLEQANKLDPRYPEARYLLARVYQKLGRKEEAEEQFAKFREVRAKTPRMRR